MKSTLHSTDRTAPVLNGKHRYRNVVKAARKYVFSLYNEHLSSEHYFHTYTRALEVVKACKELAKAMTITESEREVILLAV